MERNSIDAPFTNIDTINNKEKILSYFQSHVIADNNYNDYDNKRYFGDLDENERKVQTINMIISGSEDGTLFRAKISLSEKIREEEKLISKKKIEEAKNK